MMKILEAFGEPISYGGQESFVLNMLSEMDRDQMQIDLLTPYYCDSNYAHTVADELGIGLHALGCSFAPGSLRSGERGRLRQFLCSHSYDVIHIHSGSNLMLALYAEEAHRAGIKKILLPKGNEPDIDDIPQAVRKHLTFVLLDNVNQALEEALVK